jgi:hypothetical protein
VKASWNVERNQTELIMRSIVLAVAILVGLIASASAQKAEVEAANVKWMEFFSKGDFQGVASLYTVDATAFPPGSGMVKGRIAIRAMWKGLAERVSDLASQSFCGDWRSPSDKATSRTVAISYG